MAIALDATSTGTTANDASSKTWSHTVAGSDRLLIVGAMARDPTAADMVVSGITYNGVALTKIRHDENTVPVNAVRVEFWRLIAPATGANDIVITWAGTNAVVVGGAISLTGVDQAAPVEDHDGDNSDSATTATVNVTVTTDQGWAVDVLMTGDAGALAAGAGQTEFAVQENTGQFGDGVGMSYQGPESPSDVTMSWTWDTGNPYAHSAATVKPAAGGAALPPFVQSNFLPQSEDDDQGRFNELDIRNWW